MMNYRTILDVPESPDRQETLAYIEMDAWVHFACAMLSSGVDSKLSCSEADRMLQEFQDRFVAVEESDHASI